MKMWVYVVRRVALLVPVIIGVVTILFVLFSILPITTRIESVVASRKFGYDPTIPCSELGQAGTTCPNPAYVYGVHVLHLNQTIPVQYAYYLYNSFTFNWGVVNQQSTAAESLGVIQGHTVAQVISWFLPYTIELAIIALVMILLIAFPLGNYAAVFRNRPIDQGARVFSFVFYALPGFLLGTVVILAAQAATGGYATTCFGNSNPYFFFYGSWPAPHCLGPGIQTYPNWMANGVATSPTGIPTLDAIINAITVGNAQQSSIDWSLAWNSFYRMLLPAFVIAIGAVALILRYVRNSMLEVLNLDFIRTARAKGAPESAVIRRHAGRNSLNVTVTILGLTFAFFIGGFPIIEVVFGLNGVGRMFAYAVNFPFDYAIIFGSTLLFTFIVVVANIIVDVMVAYLDPRVRLG